MKKAGNKLLIFFLILVQSLLAMAVGIAVLYNASGSDVPANVYAGDLDIGGRGYEEAARAIEADYEARFGTWNIRLMADDDTIYEIPFSSIDAAVDGMATLEPLMSIDGIGGMTRLIRTHFGNHTTVLSPVIKFNESKLRMKLIDLSESINRDPVDARIYYRDGLIEKERDDPGVSLNVNNAADLIRRQLATDPFAVIDLRAGKALDTVYADVTMKDFDAIQVVLGEYSTSIKDPALDDSVESAVESINGIVLAPEGDASGRSEFSFVETIISADPGAVFDEGYCQVASTMYASLLRAGIPAENITRLPHKLTVDYIEPGLDAMVAADAYDLRFRNPFSNTVAIYAVKRGTVVTVAIAGSRDDRPDRSVISTQIVNKSSPPVYYVENRDLAPGEQVVLDPGKEGITVRVYRNEELISTDSYEAESSIVQIGPQADPGSKNK